MNPHDEFFAVAGIVFLVAERLKFHEYKLAASLMFLASGLYFGAAIVEFLSWVGLW